MKNTTMKKTCAMESTLARIHEMHA